MIRQQKYAPGVRPRFRTSFVPACAVAAMLFAVLLAYSQTSAFLWDEGFHLLAAQLVAHGKRPYLDFCFPQPPGNAFAYAAVMRVVGESWRVVHATAAALTVGTILMAAHFVYSRTPVAQWRVPGSIAAALLIGLHAAVIEYATLGQPYALCLFLLVAAFRVAVFAAHRPTCLPSFAAGLLASAASATSLLAAPAFPVLLVWTWKKSGRRACVVFLAAAVVAFLPVLWLFARAPRAVIFNLFEYQLFYRRTNWEDATPHDWHVLTSGLTSAQALILVLLAAAGWWFIARRSNWDPARRAEFSFCGWLAAAVAAELCLAHPTFPWYFVLVIPFLAILAAVGLYAVVSRVPILRPGWCAALLLAVFSVACARTLYLDRDRFTWSQLETVANSVNRVTPPGSALWADEAVYFLTRRPPAEGTEFSYTETVELPDRLAGELHIVSLDELQRRAAAGAFGAVETCEDAEEIGGLHLPAIFRQSMAVGHCHVFWDWAGGTR